MQNLVARELVLEALLDSIGALQQQALGFIAERVLVEVEDDL